jgi:alpha-mannosidase
VDVNVTLFFNDVNKMVKLAVPVPNSGSVIGQTAFGTEDLFTDGREMISHRFTAVESGEKYVAIFDKSRYGGHFEDGTLYLSLVRGTTYCAHPIEDRLLIPNDRFTRKMDQSEHNYFFRVAVCDEAELDRKANEFNRKPYAVNVFPLGEMDTQSRFDVSVSNKNISLVTMKKSDKRDGYILRLINNYKDAQETNVTVGKDTQAYIFGKYEVKTLFYDGSLHELEIMEI